MTSSSGRHDYAKSLCTAAAVKLVEGSSVFHPLRAALRIKPGSALNRPVEDWGKLLGDAAAVSAMLDRLLHHGHVLKCGPRSWRTKIDLPPQEAVG